MAVCGFQENLRHYFCLNEACAPLEIIVPQLCPGRKKFLAPPLQLGVEQMCQASVELPSITDDTGCGIQQTL